MSAMLPNWLFKLIQLLIIFGVGSLLIYLGADNGTGIGFISVVAASFVTLWYVRFIERRQGLERSELRSFRKDFQKKHSERQLPPPEGDER